MHTGSGSLGETWRTGRLCDSLRLIQIPILLMGGLSGRVDQTVHTMSLLHKFRAKRPHLYVLNGESIAWVLDQVRVGPIALAE